MIPKIELSEVSKHFGDTPAVDNLTLTVGPGEVFAFLGPNGAGKTTTIRMIVGLLRPSSGKVTVDGQDPAVDGSPVKQILAYVPDEPFLYEKLTGRDLLQFTAQIHRISITAQAFAKKMEYLSQLLGLGDWLDDLTESYSHGMKQRVVLTAAMLHEPKVLVIDEPTVGLDPAAVRRLQILLRQLAEQGATVFLSTHSLNIAEAVAHRVGIIDHGRLITAGTIQQLAAIQGVERATLEQIFFNLTAEDEQDQ